MGSFSLGKITYKKMGFRKLCRYCGLIDDGVTRSYSIVCLFHRLKNCIERNWVSNVEWQNFDLLDIL